MALKCNDKRIRHCSHPAYRIMITIARRQGLPTNFRTDLIVHDKRVLATLAASKSFLWCLYADGTHIGTSKADRAFVDSLGAMDRAILFLWDGSHLRRIATDSDRDFAVACVNA